MDETISNVMFVKPSRAPSVVHPDRYQCHSQDVVSPSEHDDTPMSEDAASQMEEGTSAIKVEESSDNTYQPPDTPDSELVPESPKNSEDDRNFVMLMREAI